MGGTLRLYFNVFVSAASHTEPSDSAAQTYISCSAIRDNIAKSVMSCLREGTLAGLVLALTLSAPVDGVAQRVKKFVDTFDERYPAEQAPMPSPAKRDGAPQSDSGAQQTGSPKPEAATKVVQATRFIRTKRAKPLKSHFLTMRRSDVDASARVPAGDRKSDAYLMRSEWMVVRWVSGDCKLWHNDLNVPSGYGWSAVAFANTSDEAYLKMMRLYRMRGCV